MSRWFPSPPLSVALLVMWLLLNQSLAPGHLLLGALLAVVVPLWAKPLRPMAAVRFKKPIVMARLLGMALVEIVRSCFNVSRIILFTRPDGLNSQFIRVPLDLKHPHGLALLSCLINSTPGTVWVEILPDSHDLALHVFDLHDEAWWIDTIKTRYEQPLIEIFE
ncbi:Na+/H+ antiporter subunit E [Halomonas sp. MCCC 1A11036]|uniref:Na+/H+ antiporter subunit E n=1 Tax=Billgrantia zhangzhouensis TaxID=2733481 RepID=A0ABS9AGW1_9GAMM|nr:Na+/H+ antiporter subunit E [Halomonas zhangzhouensis]MCE8020972.1 Na+/H+ antiporter subunit E [Halomonas zhangzhouensis]